MDDHRLNLIVCHSIVSSKHPSKEDEVGLEHYIAETSVYKVQITNREVAGYGDGYEHFDLIRPFLGERQNPDNPAYRTKGGGSTNS